MNPPIIINKPLNIPGGKISVEPAYHLTINDKKRRWNGSHIKSQGGFSVSISIYFMELQPPARIVDRIL